MVYPGHRSSGCMRCIQRKVKCDEGKPGCERCRKRKEDCPGYVREKYKFIGDKDKQSRRQSEQTQSSTSSRDTASLQSTSINSLNATQVPKSWEEEAISWYFKNWVLPPIREGGVGWFGFLPEMYREAGEDSCIRSAVKAASLAGFSNATGLSHLAAEARLLYGKTLTMLNAALNNENLARDDETITAILILVIFEVITSGKRPMDNHLDGLLALVQLRGPEQLQTDRSRSVFRLVHMHVQMRALAQKKRYNPAIFDNEVKSLPLKAGPEKRLVQRFHILYHIIEFCAFAKELILDTNLDDEKKTKLLNKMEEVMDTDNQLEQWVAQMDAEHYYQEHERDGNHIITYPTPLTASVWNIHRYVRIILHETLIQCAIALDVDSWTPQPVFMLEAVTDVSKSTAIIQTMASEICSSIAYNMGEVDITGNPTHSTYYPGRAAALYLMMWPLVVVRLGHFTTDTQRKYASLTLERIGREAGIKQAFVMLQNHDIGTHPFER